jgi:hypothetical protein
VRQDDQDIATVRDVLRTFGGRHVCAAFDRIVSALPVSTTPTRPPSLPPTQAELTATLASNYEPEPVESEE